MPDSEIRRRMYYHIYDTLLANGYEQVSVWGFLKGGKGKYSSVTREQYLGLGPSAGTYTGKQFLFNTFNMEKYISGPVQDQLPYEYIMDVTPHMERLFWVYWRLYETVIPREVYRQRFDRDFTEDFKSLLYGAEMMKYMVVRILTCCLPKGDTPDPPATESFCPGFHQSYLDCVYTGSLSGQGAFVCLA